MKKPAIGSVGRLALRWVLRVGIVTTLGALGAAGARYVENLPDVGVGGSRTAHLGVIGAKIDLDRPVNAGDVPSSSTASSVEFDRVIAKARYTQSLVNLDGCLGLRGPTRLLSGRATP